jgi:hypothetical protein
MKAPDETGGPGDTPSPHPPVPPATDTPADQPDTPADQARRSGHVVLGVGGVALGMHLTVGVAYALSLVLAPLWVSALLDLWWLALLLAGLALLARRSLLVLAVPLLAIASWTAFIAVGHAWFGWR